MKDLQDQRKTLQSSLRRMEDSHNQQFSQYISKESDYQESARKIREVYAQLSQVCDELNDPIPVRF